MSHIMPTRQINHTWVFCLVFLCVCVLMFSTAQAEGKNELPIINRTFAIDESLKITGEIRHRHEFRDNFNFNKNVNDEDGFDLLRTRFNIDWQPDSAWRVFWQLQDARSFGRNGGRAPLFDDESFDIRQFYIDVRDLFDGRLTIRIGRQELNYGDQRLIGGLDWTNTARSFDAVKLMYTLADWDIDAFWSRVVQIDPGPWPNEFNSDDDFAGLYATYRGFDKNTVEAYYFFRDTKNKTFSPLVGTADQKEHTIGGRAVGDKLFESDWGAWDYTADVAYQFGDFGAVDINAYMWLAKIGYKFNHSLKPFVSFEYDYASGDNHRTDGERGTFDNLFPTNHKFYGYMDVIGFQNMHDINPSFGFYPTDKLKVWVDIHMLYVNDITDSLYNASLTATRTPVSGIQVDDHVGDELDITVSYRWNSYLSFLAGYSHFFAGQYLTDTGRSDDGDFYYMQTAIKF